MRARGICVSGRLGFTAGGKFLKEGREFVFFLGRHPRFIGVAGCPGSAFPEKLLVQCRRVGVLGARGLGIRLPHLLEVRGDLFQIDAGLAELLALFGGQQLDKADGVVALEAGEQLHFGHEEGAQAGDDLATAVVDPLRAALQLITVFFRLLAYLAGLGLRLVYDQLGFALRVFDLVLSVLTGCLQRFLQRFFDTLVMLQLVVEVAHLVFEPTALVGNLLPLRSHDVEKIAHLARVVAAQALIELLLPDIKRRQLHSGWVLRAGSTCTDSFGGLGSPP